MSLGGAGNVFYLRKVTWEQNILTLNTYGGTLKRNHILKLKLSMATKNINMRKAVVRFTF